MKSISQVRHALAVEGLTNILRIREVCQERLAASPEDSLRASSGSNVPARPVSEVKQSVTLSRLLCQLWNQGRLHQHCCVET
jgi:hypothetical protein